MALQAYEWTKEHVVPWMFKGGRGLIGWALRGYHARQQSELLLNTAAALPARSCVRMHLICEPGTKHGLFIRDGKATMCFKLRLTSVAPFGVRPHSISAMFVLRRADEDAMQNAGSTRAEAVKIPEHKITYGFMGPGDPFDFEIDREVEFKHEMPPAGTTMVVWCDATMTLLGPWAHEYDQAKHEQSIFVDCRYAV
jgi:hypothetical protein